MIYTSHQNKVFTQEAGKIEKRQESRDQKLTKKLRDREVFELMGF